MARDVKRSGTRYHSKGFLNTKVTAMFEKVHVTVEIDGQVVEEKSTVRRVREFKGIDTGAALGDSVGEVLDEQFLKPIVLKTSDDIQGVEFLFDYYGIRYHLLMEYNNETEICKENECLQDIYEALRDGDNEKEERAVVACLDLFWRYIVEDCELRPMKNLEKPSPTDRYRKKEASKIQLKTLEDGGFSKVVHKARLDYPLTEPIENPCPDVRLFQKDEIKVLEELSAHVLKVEIHDEIFCLKYGNSRALSREIGFLSKMPRHPSLLRLIGVVDAGEGQVDQFVIPFVSGEPLQGVQFCTSEQKKRWKTQIADAVRVLHENDIIWGDAKADNIMIEDKRDCAILIDFGDIGNTRIEKQLHGTREGDLQGVSWLGKFIDCINESP